MPHVKTKSRRPLPRILGELVALYPPQAVYDDIDCHNTQEMIDRLLSVPGPTKDQLAYLDTLTILLEAFEDEQESFDAKDATPLEVLRLLVAEHGMSPGELGAILGDRSLGTRVLKGQRELSKAHIRALSEHFQINPGAFL